MATERGAASNRRNAAICAAFFLCLFAIWLFILAGCGSQRQLTAGETDAALAALDDVERAYDDGDCRRAEAAARKLSGLALAVGEQADDDFRDAYRQSADRLEELVVRQCEPAPSEPTGATGSTGTSGATGNAGPTDGGGTDNGGVAPTPDTGGNDQGGGNDEGGGQPPPADGGGGGNDQGGGNPDSGGVRPQ